MSKQLLTVNEIKDNYGIHEIDARREETKKRNRGKIKRFLEHKDFNEEQISQLDRLLADVSFFLELKPPKRKNVEQQLRQAKIKQCKAWLARLRTLANDKDFLYYVTHIPHVIEFRSYFSVHLEEKKKELETELEYWQFKRGSTQKSLREALLPVFWILGSMGFGQRQQIDLIYDLFVEFNFDDYGKEMFDEEKEKRPDKRGAFIGEPEQKERIRIEFQQPAMKGKYETLMLLKIAKEKIEK